MNSIYYLFNNDFKKVSKDKHALKRMIAATDEDYSVLESFGLYDHSDYPSQAAPAIQGCLLFDNENLSQIASEQGCEGNI